MTVFAILAWTPFIAACTHFLRKQAAFLAVLVSLASFVLAIVSPLGESWAMPWLGQGGDLSLQWDAWGRLLVLLVSGIGVVVKVYAAAYLKERVPEFMGRITLFEFAMLGIAVSESFLALFLFWELTTIASYGLISWKQDNTSFAAAIRAWWVTGATALVMLAGVIGALQVGVSGFSDLASTPLPDWVLTCFMIGAIGKSAQVPFQFWLPGAMAAPAPVSAYLHSATMVKAGVFLLARFQPAFIFSPVHQQSLLWLGLATLVFGGVVALRQDDLKRLLAYSTIAALGTMMALIGLPSPLAAKALIGFMVAHALYKSTLFLTAGTIEAGTGNRLLSQSGGWFRGQTWVAAPALLASLSMVGLPLSFGFVGKELSLKAMGDSGAAMVLLVLGLLLMSAVPWSLWLGKQVQREWKALPKGMAITWATGLAGIVLGIAPAFLTLDWLNEASAELVSGKAKVGFQAWYGVNQELWISLALVVLSAGLALAVNPFRKDSGKPTEGEQALQAIISQVRKGSAPVIAKFQNGSLRGYLLWILSSFFLIVFLQFKPSSYEPDLQPTAIDIALVGLMVLSTVVALRVPGRLTAILALGGVGLGMTSIYAFYSAPDLALTNLVIEVLSLVLIAGFLWRLPRFRLISSKVSRRRDLFIGVVAGIGFFALGLPFLSTERPDFLYQFYVENSKSGALAKNMVNAILVDFRAFDTFGEIAVLLGAAIGVGLLLRKSQREAEA